MKEIYPEQIQPLKEILNHLNVIDRTYAAERKKAISELQEKIWNEPALQDDEELYFLEELTGDLNFYEPIERDRDTALGYYDDNKLTEVISAARKMVEEMLSNTNQG